MSFQVRAHNPTIESEDVLYVGEKIQIPYISCKGGLGFEVNEADTERKKRHAHALVPLMRLDEFVAKNIGTKPIKLMKMDTEGSEIDILLSGMSVFESGQIENFIVEITPKKDKDRNWEDAKGISLEKGISILEQVGTYFDGFIALDDHELCLKDEHDCVFQVRTLTNVR